MSNGCSNLAVNRTNRGMVLRAVVQPLDTQALASDRAADDFLTDFLTCQPYRIYLCPDSQSTAAIRLSIHFIKHCYYHYSPLYQVTFVSQELCMNSCPMPAVSLFSVVRRCSCPAACDVGTSPVSLQCMILSPEDCRPRQMASQEFPWCQDNESDVS